MTGVGEDQRVGQRRAGDGRNRRDIVVGQFQVYVNGDVRLDEGAVVGGDGIGFAAGDGGGEVRTPRAPGSTATVTLTARVCPLVNTPSAQVSACATALHVTPVGASND